MARATRDQLLMKLGAAKRDAGRAANLVMPFVPKDSVTTASLEFKLDRAKLRQVRRREGRYVCATAARADSWSQRSIASISSSSMAASRACRVAARFTSL